MGDVKNQWRLLICGLIGVVLVLCLVLGLQARARMHKKQTLHSRKDFNDFDRWMQMTPRFLAAGGGHAYYVDDKLPNPPIILVVFAPFSWLPPAEAQLAWALCKAPLIVGIVGMAVALARRGAGFEAGSWKVPWLLAGLAWFWPVIGDIQQGQTNLLMLLPLTLGLWLAQDGCMRGMARGGGRDLAAGILIALAIAIKVTPLIFLIYFLGRQRWGVVAGILVGLVLWLLLVPGALFGWQRNLVWLAGWMQVMIMPYVAQGSVDYYSGQSIASLVSRLLRQVPVFINHSGTSVYVNVVDWPEPLVRWIIRGVLGVMGLVGMGWLWRNRPRAAGVEQEGRGVARQYLLETAAVAVFMLWASERTWVPHYVALGLALAAVATVAGDREMPARIRSWALAALGFAAAAMVLTSDLNKLLFGPDGGEYVKTFGVCLWPALGLVLVILAAGWRPKTMAVSGSDGGLGRRAKKQ